MDYKNSESHTYNGFNQNLNEHGLSFFTLSSEKGDYEYQKFLDETSKRANWLYSNLKNVLISLNGCSDEDVQRFANFVKNLLGEFDKYYMYPFSEKTFDETLFWANEDLGQIYELVCEEADKLAQKTSELMQDVKFSVQGSGEDKALSDVAHLKEADERFLDFATFKFNETNLQRLEDVVLARKQLDLIKRGEDGIGEWKESQADSKGILEASEPKFLFDFEREDASVMPADELKEYRWQIRQFNDSLGKLRNLISSLEPRATGVMLSIIRDTKAMLGELENNYDLPLSTDEFKLIYEFASNDLTSIFDFLKAKLSGALDGLRRDADVVKEIALDKNSEISSEDSAELLKQLEHIDVEFDVEELLGKLDQSSILKLQGELEKMIRITDLLFEKHSGTSGLGLN